MQYLSSCLTARKKSKSDRSGPTRQRQRPTIQTLVDQAPSHVYSSTQGPYVVSVAGLYEGDRPIEGSDKTCALGFLPESRCSAESDVHSPGVRAVEKAIDDGARNEDNIRRSVVVTSRLFGTLDGKILREYPYKPRIGFSQGDTYTEIGVPIHTQADIMPWGSIITENANIKRIRPEKSEPFEMYRHHRPLTRWASLGPYPKEYLLPTYPTPESASTGLLNDISRSQGAGPRSTTPHNLKLAMAVYQPSYQIGDRDTYWFRLYRTNPQDASEEESFDQFDNRETSEDSTARFERSFNTVLNTVKILSAEGCTDVDATYTTNDDFSAKISDIMVGPESARKQLFSVTMKDLRTRVEKVNLHES